MSYRCEFKDRCNAYEHVKFFFDFLVKKYNLDLNVGSREFMGEFLEKLAKEIVEIENLFYDGLNSSEYEKAITDYLNIIDYRIKASLANLLNIKF